MTSTILLSHLQTSASGIPLPTLQSVLSHHLSNSSSTTTLTVSQLTATAISAPFFHPPLEYANVQAFETAFRHAVHLLSERLSKEEGTSRVNISRWTGDVINGIQGGHPILRLAACGGILLGVQDLRNNADVNDGKPDGGASIQFSRTSVESETLVALAEVLDSITVHTEWENEFQHQVQQPSQHSNPNTRLMAFILASHSLPLIDPQRLAALPLHTLARLLTSILVSFFDSSDLESNSKTLMDVSHIPSLARLSSVIFSVLLDSNHSRISTRTLRTVSDTFHTLLDLSKIIEQTYSTDPSNQIQKQFLFTILIISQSVLTSLVYIPPHIITHPDTSITPSSLALMTLQTLTHLSLVIFQLGGITKGFEQLQKAFYLSIDILSSSRQIQTKKRKGEEKEEQNKDVEAYVQSLSQFLQSQSPEAAATFRSRAKLSFALSTFEQLIPSLSPYCIINHVWSVCHPYLVNPSDSNREIYESAHSVVLSMLVHDLQRRQELNSRSFVDLDDSEGEILWTRFIQCLVPFYAKCLVEDTMLAVPQLRHAYSSLVQCASVWSNRDVAPATMSTTEVHEAAAALPWYCIQLVLDSIDALSSSSSQSHPPHRQLPLSRKDRLHRLHLMLVSSLPFLPLEMLDRCLESVRGVLVGYSREMIEEEEAGEGREKDNERKKELVEILFEMLLNERMGGEGKVVGLKWWYENLGLVSGVIGKERKGKVQKMLQSRL